MWPKVFVAAAAAGQAELIGAELDQRTPSQIHIMSGFRTPQYNEQASVERADVRTAGISTATRRTSSWTPTASADGRLPDGRINRKDAQVLLAVAEDVEAQHPDLVGGLSAYFATSTHGPFVHVDARGTRARW